MAGNEADVFCAISSFLCMKKQRNSMYNLKNPINLHQILKKFLKKHLPKKKALPKGATSILPQIPIPT